MSLVNRNLIVFDLETDGLDVVSGKDNITQIAAVAIDFRQQKVLKESEFETWVCPAELYDCDKEGKRDEYINNHRNALEKHAEWRNCEVNDYLDLLLERGLPEKEGLTLFLDHCKEYKKGRLPAAGGQNIVGFDLPIIESLCKKYKKKKPFGFIDVFDLRHMNAHWLLYADNPPKSYSMGNIRPHFGMSDENAHDAVQDVKDTALLICRYLKLYQALVKKVDILNHGVAN